MITGLYTTLMRQYPQEDRLDSSETFRMVVYQDAPTQYSVEQVCYKHGVPWMSVPTFFAESLDGAIALANS